MLNIYPILSFTLCRLVIIIRAHIHLLIRHSAAAPSNFLCFFFVSLFYMHIIQFYNIFIMFFYVIYIFCCTHIYILILSVSMRLPRRGYYPFLKALDVFTRHHTPHYTTSHHTHACTYFKHVKTYEDSRLFT